MDRRGLLVRILVALLGVLIFALSGAMAWVVLNDYQLRDVVPHGVSIAGQDLTGHTVAKVRATIEAAVSAPMLRPVTVSGDHKTWTLDPKDYVSIDTETMVRDAYADWYAAPFLKRVDSELRGTPLPKDVRLLYAVDSVGISNWVKQQTATKVDRKPIDATRKVVGYGFKITPAVYGARVERKPSTQDIAAALSAETALAANDRSVTLSVTPLKPKVFPSNFKTAIIVSLSECRIRLYNGAKLVKSYSCAPGQPAWPTPTGDFKIVTKDKFAPWYNPHSSWSAGMPEVIAGGPDNPMGDTKIGIDYPGVFMHSVPPGEFGSIGSHASHGCMRMMPSSVHDLYDRVHIGDPVFIRD